MSCPVKGSSLLGSAVRGTTILAVPDLHFTLEYLGTDFHACRPGVKLLHKQKPCSANSDGLSRKTEYVLQICHNGLHHLLNVKVIAKECKVRYTHSTPNLTCGICSLTLAKRALHMLGPHTLAISHTCLKPLSFSSRRTGKHWQCCSASWPMSLCSQATSHCKRVDLGSFHSAGWRDTNQHQAVTGHPVHSGNSGACVAYATAKNNICARVGLHGHVHA